MFQTEHLFTAITVLGVLVAAARGILPDENQIFCPELLLNQILAHIHYMPDSWRHYAHTTRVRQQFCQVFQYKIVWIVMELFSPLITPFVLIFWLRPRIGQILEFFHNYTVQVPGLGDVCSFSQMDVARHGSDRWRPADGKGPKGPAPGDAGAEAASNSHLPGPATFQPEDKLEPAAMGKTEISLLHFAITNPTWNPPIKANQFLKDLRKRAVADGEELQRIQAGVLDNPLLASLTSIGYFYNPAAAMGPVSGLAPLGTGRSMCLKSTAGPASKDREAGVAELASEGPGLAGGCEIPPGALSDSLFPAESPLDSPVRFRGPGVRTSEGPLTADSMRSSTRRGGLGQPAGGFQPGLPNVGMPTSAGSSLVLGSLQASGMLPSMSPYAGNVSAIGEMDNYGAVCEMTMSVMYLHEIHRRMVRGRDYGSTHDATAAAGQTKTRSNANLSRYRFDNRATPASGNFIHPENEVDVNSSDPESGPPDVLWGTAGTRSPGPPHGMAPVEMYQVGRLSSGEGGSSDSRNRSGSAGVLSPPASREAPPVLTGLPLEHLYASDATDSDGEDERPPTEFNLA